MDCDEIWENERSPTPVRVFGVRLHSMGLSLREIVAVLDWLGIDRSHGAVWNWTHIDPRRLHCRRVAVDEKQIKVDGEKKWLDAAIDVESKLLLEVMGRFGITAPKVDDVEKMIRDGNTHSYCRKFTEFLRACDPGYRGY